ncbi:MAG TPA: hypothetical protein VGP82_07470 [Ktedonobacterales bacterium]|nr:hypothetical protein [Ktedonobacterales bacterium]
MEQVSDFGEQLAALYTALADADAVAAKPAASGAAAAVAAAVAAARGAEKGRYLLRALDDAIAALEVAALLADEYQGTVSGTTPPDTSNPLYSLYADFAASQPGLVTLYHYRNALVAHLSGEAPQAQPASAPVGADAQPPLPEETDQPG